MKNVKLFNETCNKIDAFAQQICSLNSTHHDDEYGCNIAYQIISEQALYELPLNDNNTHEMIDLASYITEVMIDKYYKE